MDACSNFENTCTTQLLSTISLVSNHDCKGFHARVYLKGFFGDVVQRRRDNNKACIPHGLVDVLYGEVDNREHGVPNRILVSLDLNKHDYVSTWSEKTPQLSNAVLKLGLRFAGRFDDAATMDDVEGLGGKGNRWVVEHVAWDDRGDLAPDQVLPLSDSLFTF